jgi:hypothetical protein
MLVLILATIALAACTPARPSLTTAGDPPQFSAPRVPTRVTAAIGAEITSFASKLEPQRTYGGEYGFLSNSPLMNVVHSDQCPTAERRFVGTNRGCWKNAEFDRLYITASTSLEAQERADAVVQALRVMTEEAGIIGIAYNAESIPVRRGLVGPGPRWPGQVGTTWNVHLWHWTT